MALDLKSGSEGGREREALRSILRQWDAPTPPPEIEEELRRTFRQRRARRWRPLWLSLAAALVAGLALILVGEVEWTHRRSATDAPEPARPSAPQPSPSAAIALDRSVSRPLSAVPRRAERPRPRPKPRPDAEGVIVEPGQGELLVLLAERLQAVRQPRTVVSIAPVEVVPAGVRDSSIRELARTDVPPYEGEWERVSDVWPLVQLSAPTTGR
jgi:hypothetical protein